MHRLKKIKTVKILKIKILKYILAICTVFVAFLACLAVDRAVHVTGASIWSAPIIWFSVFFILIYVNIIILKRKYILELIFLGVFFMSFAFTQEFRHLGILVLVNLLAYWGLARIRKDLELNIKISLLKSIRMGSSLLLLAIALMISSQYYFAVKKFDSERLIPQFRATSMTGNATSKILAWLSPDLKNLDQDSLTVDQFILQIQSDQEQQSAQDMDSQIEEMIEVSNPDMTDTQKKLLKEDMIKQSSIASIEIKNKQEQLIIQEGRKKFSELAGQQLSGKEKVSDILADIVNRKINQYFNPGLNGEQKKSPLPIIMAVGLFLTIWPLGSVLNIAWMLLAELIVRTFIKTNLIHINKIPVEMEVIE